MNYKANTFIKTNYKTDNHFLYIDTIIEPMMCLIYLSTNDPFKEYNLGDTIKLSKNWIPNDFYIEVTDMKELEFCEEQLNIARKIQVFK